MFHPCFLSLYGPGPGAGEGADKKTLMKKTIGKKVADVPRTAAEVAEDEDDEEEEEEEEPEGKWYYLGGNSVGELILNVIALAIAVSPLPPTLGGRRRERLSTPRPPVGLTPGPAPHAPW